MKLYYNKKEVSRAYIQTCHNISVLDLNSKINKGKDLKSFTVDGYKYEIDIVPEKKTRRPPQTDKIKITDIVYKDKPSKSGETFIYTFNGLPVKLQEVAEYFDMHVSSVRLYIKGLKSCKMDGIPFTCSHPRYTYSIVHHEIDDREGLTMEEVCGILNYCSNTIIKFCSTKKYTPDGFRVFRTLIDP